MSILACSSLVLCVWLTFQANSRKRATGGVLQLWLMRFPEDIVYLTGLRSQLLMLPYWVLTECGIWLCALSVFCSFLCLGWLRWIALGLCLFGALLVQRSCVLR